jgi:hypothetical protein
VSQKQETRGQRQDTRYWMLEKKASSRLLTVDSKQ